MDRARRGTRPGAALPRTKSIKLTFACPASFKAELDRYAAPHAQIYGEAVDAATDVHDARSRVQRRKFLGSVIAPSSGPVFAGRALVAVDFGTAKPDPAVYRAALARLGWKAEETLFIDDVATNVEGAVQAGLVGHLYRDREIMQEALVAFLCKAEALGGR
jgi:hypothetical protein